MNKQILLRVILVLLIIVSIVLLLMRKNEAFLYSIIITAITGIITYLTKNSDIKNGSEITIKGNNNKVENITQINGENNKLNIEGDGNSANKIKQ